MKRKITLEDVQALASEKGLPLTDTQIAQVHGSVSAMQECAARLRAGLRRNDEPAFGFRHMPSAASLKEAN